MKITQLAGLALVLTLRSGVANAESLRCASGIVAEGDSRLSLVYKCGNPTMSDSFCAPVYFIGGVHPVPEPWASYAVPCQMIDQWVYDRGPGQLLATVYLRNGVVQSIVYSRVPP